MNNYIYLKLDQSCCGIMRLHNSYERFDEDTDTVESTTKQIKNHIRDNEGCLMFAVVVDGEGEHEEIFEKALVKAGFKLTHSWHNSSEGSELKMYSYIIEPDNYELDDDVYDSENW
jgi:hypothetical protein